MTDRGPERGIHELRAEIFEPVKVGWGKIGAAIATIEHLSFSKPFPASKLKAAMEHPSAVNIVLRDGLGTVAGYTYALPEPGQPGTAWIQSTALYSGHRHRGYVALLMQLLESELVKRGYTFMTRNVSIKNGYADTIAKVYAGRIVEQYDRISEYGPQRHFKIALNQHP